MDLSAHVPLMRRNQQQLDHLLGDDRLVLALGCRTLIAAFVAQRPCGQIVGAATSEAATLAVVERERPDLVMVSDLLEEGCGLSLVMALKGRWPHLPVLLLVMGNARSPRLQARVHALQDGVAVVWDQRFGTGSEIAALHSLSVGARFVDPALGQPRQPLPRLSQREREVLHWLAHGERNSAIAERMKLSQETVKTHVSNLMGKLGVRNRQQAILAAWRLELLDG